VKRSDRFAANDPGLVEHCAWITQSRLKEEIAVNTLELKLSDAVTLAVPANLQSITTYVLAGTAVELVPDVPSQERVGRST
jgi:hypothetical protein